MSLTLPAGQIAGLVGHNGAGKTTMLRILTGVLRPTAGVVRLAGHPLYRDRIETAAGKRLTGAVADVPPFYDRLTAREFVRFSAQMYGLAASAELERRIADLLMYFQLDEDGDQRVATYSLGMRKKTAVCAALVHDPAVMILDEPFDGLDPAARRGLKEVLRSHAARQRTVLLSTHGLEVAQDFCDRIIVIHRGRIIADGDMVHLRSLVGARPMAPLEEVFLRLTGRHEGDAAPPDERGQLADVGASP